MPSSCKPPGVARHPAPAGPPPAAPAGPPPGALQAQHAGQLSLLPLPLPAGHLRLLGRLGLVTLTGGHLAGPGLGRPRTRSPASLRRSQACCSVPHSRFPHCPGSSHLPAASNQSITSTASPRILVASTFDSGVGWATARRAAGATRQATVPSTASSACQTSPAPLTTRIGEARLRPPPGLTPPRSASLPRRNACCSPGPALTFTRTPHTGRRTRPTRPHGAGNHSIASIGPISFCSHFIL